MIQRAWASGWCAMLCAATGCTPAADIEDGGLRGQPPSESELACRIGMVGARCPLPGLCERGLVCEAQGGRDVGVCTRVCEDDEDCPWGAECGNAWPGPDGAPLKRCILPCDEEATCSCALSRCLPVSETRSACQ